MTMLSIVILVLLIASLFVFPSVGGNGGVRAQDFHPTGSESSLSAEAQSVPVDQIIVKYKSSANLVEAEAAQTSAQMRRLSEAAGVTLAYFRPMSGDAHVLRLPARMSVPQALEIAAKLAALPEVEFAEPDYMMQPIGNPAQGIFLTTNDPQYGNQWHYFAPGAGHYGVNAPAAWDITTGSASIYSAVIDTGILDHTDLSGRWIGGYDFISDTATANDGGGRDADPHDPGDWVTANECGYSHLAENSSWHGTHVAGTIGAASNNGVGVAGLNWVSKVVPLRVLGKCGGYTSDIADAMRWAAGLSVSGVPANPYPAKVINMSLGGYSPSGCPAAYQTAASDVVAAGSTLIVAAGNSDDDASLYTPSNCANVITIAATNRDGGRAYYSNYGTAVEVAAPGGAQSVANDPNGVLSTLNTGTTAPGSDAYVYYQGTSMAAPHVTGVVSLMYSVNPGLTSGQVTSILQSTVTTFPTGTGADCTISTCGSGIVNAPAAITAAQGPALNYKIYLPLALKAAPAPGDFNKSAPANGAISQPANPTLSWGASSGATSYEYCIDTSNDSTCNTSWVSTAASTSVGLSGLTPAASYYWQVRANNASSTTNADGGTWWSFTVAASPPPGIVNGNFESGSGVGWSEFSTHGWPIVVNSGFPGSVTPHSGAWAAWLGGGDSDISYIQQQVTVSAGAPYLTYFQWIASADSCGFDFASVLINGVAVDTYNLCSSQATGGWVTHNVNLSAYAGQSVALQIRVVTDGSLNSNLFVDDASFAFTASAANDSEPLIPFAPDPLNNLLKSEALGIR